MNTLIKAPMPNQPTLLRRFLPNADNPQANAGMRMEMMLDAIQQERERQGISYTLLGQLTGMSTNTISRTLLGKRGVFLTEVVKIAVALDVDPFVFIAASSAGAASADVDGPAVALNLDAVLTAAASVGIVGEQAVEDRLGMPLVPVTARLLATIVIRLPIALGAAAHIVKAAVK